MLKILFTSAALALITCGCSNKDDAVDSAKTSSAKSTESPKDAAPPNTSTAGKSQDTPRSTPAGTADTSKTSAANSQQAKDASDQATSKAGARSKSPHSLADKKWVDFRGMLRKCDALPTTQKEQCLVDFEDTYRALDFQCTALSKSHERQCRKYNEELKNALANLPPRSSVTHTTEPTMTSASPADPSAAERNRDSTKQQQDAAGTTLEQSKRN